MTKAIFTVNPESPYDDVEGERYHFEARGHMAHYLAVARAAIGDWVLFHEPQRAGGRKAYIGVARVAAVERDVRSADGWIVRLNDYLRFDAPVSMRDASGPYRETMLKEVAPIAAGKTLRGHSLRPVSDLDFAAIVHLGLAETFHPANAQRLRLDPAETPPLDKPPDVRAAQWVARLTNRKVRYSAFRRVVLAAYEDHCAITHLPGLVNGGGKVELEAAHIKPVEFDGPDLVVNGLALTGTVHWMFDRGLLTIANDFTVLVSHNKVPAEWRKALPQLGGKLRLPVSQRDMPHPKFLTWHRENRFGADT